jgi:hypothetical protein
MPDVCTAPDYFLVESPHHCGSHGLTLRVWLPLVSLQREDVIIAASPHRATSPVASPPEHTPTPVGLPGSFIRRTMAARSGALPFYNSTEGGSSSSDVVAPPDFIDLKPASPPPPLPLAPWALGRQTAAAAANRRPGLCPRPN